MSQSEIRKRRPGGGRKPNLILANAIRLPLPLINQLLEFKKKSERITPYQGEINEILFKKVASNLSIPLFESRVQAGFPSPALLKTQLSLSKPQPQL